MWFEVRVLRSLDKYYLLIQPSSLRRLVQQMRMMR